MANRIWINGVIRDMTPEEEKEYKVSARQATMEMARAVAPVDEVVELMVKANINTLDVDDRQAHRMRAYYPDWASGLTVKAGEKYQYNNELWKALQAHTTQTGWEPSVNTASMWALIDEVHEGSEMDPIPFKPNMELVEGKHYAQADKFYICTRSTGQAVFADLADLIGIYVTEEE